MLSFYKPNLDTGSELEYNMEFTKYVWLEVQGFKYLKNNINGRTILFDWWNPLHAIESAKNHKGIDFGYGFNSSWKFKWVREFRKNTTYVYFTHKLNNDYEFLKQMCNLSLEFSSKLDDKGIWIYNVEC